MHAGDDAGRGRRGADVQKPVPMQFGVLLMHACNHAGATANVVVRQVKGWLPTSVGDVYACICMWAHQVLSMPVHQQVRS